MSQALTLKWRPARFSEIVGQEHITQTLQNSVAGDRVSHAYLFCGPRGTGKTTSARLLAKAVNCTHTPAAERPCDQCPSCKSIRAGRFLDLIEIDAASNTGVDDIRELREKVNFSPSEGRFKVYIIDEVHMLSTAAFNALLKTLEEPPPHVKFILATTEEHKVPITIKSRCQQYNFRLLTEMEIIDRLTWMADQEGFAIELEALRMIARQAAGSLRDAESLLDQLVVAPGETITAEHAQRVLGTAANTAVLQLTNTWLESRGGDGLGIIHEALATGTDARQFCRQMVTHMRQLLLLQTAGETVALDLPPEQKEAMLLQAQRAPRRELIRAVKRFNEAALTPAGSWQPQLPLELAFIELLPEAPAPVLPVTPPAKAAPPPPAAASQSTPLENAPRQEPETTEGSAVTAKPSPPKTTPAAATDASPLTLAQITTNWRELVTRAGADNKNMPALLNMGKPMAVEGNTAVIGFDYPIFKDKFDNTSGATELLGDILSELLGRPCLVRGVVTSDYDVPVDEDQFRALAAELGGVVKKEKQ
jgi:DNA polymerase-3 subunit gamma/tau